MSDATTNRQLAVLALGGEEYALPIGAVHEIIRYTEPRSVESGVTWIRGVIALRGKIVPVLDLAARMGLAAPGDAPGRIVIVDAGSGQAGVMVDDVEVLTVSSAQLEEVRTATGDPIEAIAKVEDRLIVLLDAGGLLAPSASGEQAA